LGDTFADRYTLWTGKRGLKIVVAKRGLEYGSAGVTKDVVEKTPELKRFTNFFVVYADSVLSIDFTKMANAHASRIASGCLVTLCYHKPADLMPNGQQISNYGILKTDGEGRVLSFVEKPRVDNIGSNDVASTGTLILNRRALRLFPRSHPLDFSKDVLQALASGSESPVFGFDIENGFRYDIGTIEEYVHKQFDVLSGRLRISGVPVCRIRDEGSLPGGGRLHGRALIGPHCVFKKGVTLNGFNIVGREVYVGPGSRIEKSIVLDNARIGSRVRICEAVLGRHCVIGDGISLSKGAVLGDYSKVF